MESFLLQYILPMAAKRRWTSVCEIGASFGVSTERLLALPDVFVTVVDPCIDSDLDEKYAGSPRVKVCKGISLAVLPVLDATYECILIDGDHNWYTVYNELRVISERQLLRRGGMIFLHDVGWPFGRRDMYYQPDQIPAQYCHRYGCKGMIRGRSELSDDSGLSPGFDNALHEGGPRNGVLTAVEDFLREHRREYQFFSMRWDSGLGVLHYRESFRDDLGFLAFRYRSEAYNLYTWPRRFTLTNLPSTYMFAKSVTSTFRRLMYNLSTR
jgi:Methyltransferase domain